MTKGYNITEFDSLDKFLDDMSVKRTSGHWQDDVEEEYPDMSVYVDVNFSSLVEILTHNGFSEDEVFKMNKAIYGTVVDFYKIKDEGFHIMMFGNR